MRILPALLLGAALGFPAFAAGLPAAGRQAPAFALGDFFEESRLIEAQELFRGRTTLLSFFATWCEPCKQEIPHLKKLEDDYRGRGFRVVLVCLDIMGARNVRSYLADAGGLGLKVLCDRRGSASNLYGVTQLPANVLVGPDGVVLDSWETYRPDKVKSLAEYLSRLPAPSSREPAREALR